MCVPRSLDFFAAFGVLCTEDEDVAHETLSVRPDGASVGFCAGVFVLFCSRRFGGGKKTFPQGKKGVTFYGNQIIQSEERVLQARLG